MQTRIFCSKFCWGLETCWFS